MQNNSPIYETEMTDTQFLKFSNYIKELCGINLSDEKKTMVEGRLRKRIQKLKYPTFRKYFNYVFSDEGKRKETKIIIDLISTNKTDFFREPKHFDYLYNSLLPEFYSKGIGHERPINVWCAASSSGEEPYTIAFILEEFSANKTNFKYKNISSDISTKVLKIASKGIYNSERIAPIPTEFKRKYLLKGKNDNTGLFRVIPKVRHSIEFFRQNLTESRYDIKEKQDIVFCRNVLIYFEQDIKEKIINTIFKHMNKGGILILGHAESLNGINSPLERVDSTIYKRA